MTLLEIAQIYTDLVNADSEIPDSEYRAKDLISALRTKYLNMLMEQMQMEGIEFIDRFDATRIAFDLAKQEKNRVRPIKFTRKEIFRNGHSKDLQHH